MTYPGITNPLAAFRSVSNYATLKSDVGESLLPYASFRFVATAAIPVGSVVSIDPPASATDRPGVAVKATAFSLGQTVGVAKNAAAAAGDVVEVVVWGLAHVTVGSCTPAIGDTAVIQANSGEAAVDTDELADTIIVGSMLGGFLAVKDAANLAPIWITRG